jgi:multidrug efflux pump subunit AcrB
MRRLIQIATERRVTITMFMTAIVLFGMVSLSRLNLNLLPDISYPTLTVRAELTGAAPVDSYVITVIVTDNCQATEQSEIALEVTGEVVFKDGFEE